MEKLNGKVAVITGAGKGIGKAIAIAYAKCGIKVCCIARTLSDLDLRHMKENNKSKMQCIFCVRRGSMFAS